MKKVIVVAAAGLVLASVAAFAQMSPGGRKDMPTDRDNMHMQRGAGPMMGHGMMGGMMGSGMSHGEGGHSKGDASPSSLAYQGINAKMHKGMDITFTGNSDVDFVRGMIPHHQGAIDMAKTVLAFGKDSEVRKLAEEIVKAQESEINLLQNWLKKNGL